MGLTMEGRGHTPHHVSNCAPFKSAGMIMVVCVCIAHGMYQSVFHPCVKNAPFHGGEGMIMVVRVLYCQWQSVTVVWVCSLW